MTEKSAFERFRESQRLKKQGILSDVNPTSISSPTKSAMQRFRESRRLKNEGEDYAPLIAKSGLQGGLDVIDTPQNLLKLGVNIGEKLARNMAAKLGDKEEYDLVNNKLDQLNELSSIPITPQHLIKKVANFDTLSEIIYKAFPNLKPNSGENDTKKVISTATRFAAPSPSKFITGIRTIPNLVTNSIPKAVKSIPNLTLAKASSGIGKVAHDTVTGQYGQGAIIGGAGQYLENEGTDPITANILGLGAGLGANYASKRLSNNKIYKSAEYLEDVQKLKLKKDLEHTLDKDNVENIIDNIKKYNNNNRALNHIERPTADIAKNAKLSILARSKNFEEVRKKNVDVDNKILKTLKDKKAYGNYSASEDELGEKIRNALYKIFKTAEKKRFKATNPIYNKAALVETKLPIEDYLNFEENLNKRELDRLKKVTEVSHTDITKGNPLTSEELDLAAKNWMDENVSKTFTQGSNKEYAIWEPNASLEYLMSEAKKLDGGFENFDKNYELALDAVKQNRGVVPKTVHDAKKLNRDEINKLYIAGDKVKANHLRKYNNYLIKDLLFNTKYGEADRLYAKLSPPVQAIEGSKFLNPLIKRDVDFKSIETWKLPDETVHNNILNASKKNLTRLVNQFDNSGKSLTNVKGIFANQLLKKLTNNFKDNLSYHQFHNYVTNNSGKLKIIYSNQEIKKLYKILEILRDRQHTNFVGKIPGSNTAQHLDYNQKIEKLLNPGRGKIAKIISRIGNTVPAPSFVHTGLDNFIDYLSNSFSANNLKIRNNILEDILANPNSFLDLNTIDKRFKKMYPSNLEYKKSLTKVAPHMLNKNY